MNDFLAKCYLKQKMKRYYKSLSEDQKQLFIKMMDMDDVTIFVKKKGLPRKVLNDPDK